MKVYERCFLVSLSKHIGCAKTMASTAISHLFHIEEPSRLQNPTQRLHQLSFIQWVHPFIHYFQQAVTRRLSEFLYGHLTQ